MTLRSLRNLVFLCLMFTCVGAGLHAIGSKPQLPLQIYFIDVEGGQSTLFVTPDKHSLLIDTGWPGNEGRDANRIVAAAKTAGLDTIGSVLLTHYHVAPTGGVPQLVAKIPVKNFIDHGPNRETSDAATVQAAEA